MKPTTQNLMIALAFMASAPLSAAEVDASLDWARRVALGLPVSGVVAEVAVMSGDSVQEGQALLKLDQRGYAARVAAAKAKVQGLTHTHDEAKKELERAEQLYERMLLSDHELVEARIDFGNADAEFQAAKAALTQAEMDLQYSEVRAPFSGLVLARHAEAGQTVAAQLQSVTLIELAESGRMVAKSQVGYSRLARIKAGDQAVVTVGDKRYQGTIRSLGAEPLARGTEGPLYEVQVVFDTGGKLLRAGRAAKINLP